MGRGAFATTAKGALVLRYLSEYDENIPTLTLAKIIFRENPTMFYNVEAIRTNIRYYRNNLGEKNRKNCKVDKYAQPNKQAGFFVPKPESQDYTPYVLKSNQNNIGIISDFHIPNHREEPIRVAVEYLKKKKINTLILNGDVMDNTPFTRHGGQPPSAEDTKRWFDMAERFIESLRDYFPKASIIWTEGNHDAWMSRWMGEHAYMFGKDPYFTLQERLHLEEYGVVYIPQQRYVLAGKLVVVHGHHLIKGIIAPVNASRGLIMRAKVPTIIGHVHVDSQHTETDLHGHITTCWSTGCLCSLTPEYQPMGGKACHGFAHVTVEPDGNFKVTNMRIHKGKIL